MLLKLNKNLFEIEKGHFVITTQQKPSYGDRCISIKLLSRGIDIYNRHLEESGMADDWQKLIGTVGFKNRDLPYAELPVNTYNESDLRKIIKQVTDENPKYDFELNEMISSLRKIKSIKLLSDERKWICLIGKDKKVKGSEVKIKNENFGQLIITPDKTHLPGKLTIKKIVYA